MFPSSLLKTWGGEPGNICEKSCQLQAHLCDHRRTLYQDASYGNWVAKTGSPCSTFCTVQYVKTASDYSHADSHDVHATKVKMGL